MAVAWACSECHRSVDLINGNKLDEHTRLGSKERCAGSGKRVQQLEPR